MSSAPARVLLVEDSLADAELILHELARGIALRAQRPDHVALTFRLRRREGRP